MLVHVVLQQSHTKLSVCSVHYVNYLVGQFELFIHVFERCRYQHWRHIFPPSEIFCCIDRLIPQSHKLFENCISHCKILDQLKLFVVIFFENIEFYIQIVGITFGPRKSSESVLNFAKDHLFGTI